MRLGIIVSGSEELMVLRALQQYNFVCDVRYDSLYGPYGDKDFATVQKRIETGIHYLLEQGVAAVIVPPIFELAYSVNSVNSVNSVDSVDSVERVFPLFSMYVRDVCLACSLVGKIGFVGTHLASSQIENIFSTIQKTYSLTDVQRGTRKFHVPFAVWCKEVSMRNHFLHLLSPKNYLVNSVVKTDCRYFKDANVDTIIPLEYSYFAFEKLFHRFFNQKKMKFHGIAALSSCFAKFCADKKYDVKKDAFSVTVHHTDSLHMLEQQKKWMQLLTRGGTNAVKFVRV